MSRVEARARRRARPRPRCRSSRARRSTRCASTPRSTRRSRATRYTRHDDAVHLGIAVSLGDEGLIVPGRPRRAGPQRRGPRPGAIRDLARRARAGELDARRGPRRDVHDHEPGPVRLDRWRRRSSTSRRSRSSTSRRSSSARSSSPTPTANDAIAIRPMMHPRPVVGPPRARRRARPRGSWPTSATGSRRSRRAGEPLPSWGRCPSCGRPPRRRPVPRGARRCSTACAAARQADAVPDVLLLLEHPPVYTRGRRSAARRARRAARPGTASRASRSSTSTAAARSPTTGPASSSATRSCASTTCIAHVRTMERRAHRGARRRGRRRPQPPRGRPGLHGRLGRRPQDRLDRRARRPGRHHARLRGERRQRPRPVQWVVACGLPGVHDDLGRARDGPRPAACPAWRRETAFRFAQAHGLRQRLVSADRLQAALGAAPVPA